MGGKGRRGEGNGGKEGAWCARVSMLNGVELFFSTHTAILCHKLHFVTVTDPQSEQSHHLSLSARHLHRNNASLKRCF